MTRRIFLRTSDRPLTVIHFDPDSTHPRSGQVLSANMRIKSTTNSSNVIWHPVYHLRSLRWGQRPSIANCRLSACLSKPLSDKTLILGNRIDDRLPNSGMITSTRCSSSSRSQSFQTVSTSSSWVWSSCRASIPLSWGSLRPWSRAKRRVVRQET